MCWCCSWRGRRACASAGWYVYIGSALGPGGLAARVGRHLRRPARRHWHIDHLRRRASVRAVWWRASAERRECAWAQAFGRRPGAAAPVPGFGASDCGCPAHLWRLSGRPARPAWIPHGAWVA